MKKPFLLSLLTLLFGLNLATTAQAEIYLEPFLGYGAGKWEMGTDNEKYNGAQLGLRAGYYTLGLSAGLEYQGGKFEDKASPSHEMTAMDLGLYVGFEFPILVRAYATYFPIAKVKHASSSEQARYEGNGLKLGVGLTTLPFLNVNLEYQINTYDEDQDGSLTDKMKSTAIAVNVSCPLEL